MTKCCLLSPHSVCVALHHAFLSLAGVPAPREIVEHIAAFAKSDHSFSHEQASTFRLELMADRKFFRNKQNDLLEREFSLCEH
jgi:hypothetical protein